jgi:urease accessory protein
MSPALRKQTERWRAEGALDEVTIEERNARKSRQRLHTSKGRELGLILPRGVELQEGDVFAIEEDGGRLIVHIALQEVMVLTPLLDQQDEERWQWAVRLGHVLGNQHWPVAVIGEQILTPVTVDRIVMETVLSTHHLTEHFTIQYERRAWPKTKETPQWTTHHS